MNLKRRHASNRHPRRSERWTIPILFARATIGLARCQAVLSPDEEQSAGVATETADPAIFSSGIEERDVLLDDGRAIRASRERGRAQAPCPATGNLR